MINDLSKVREGDVVLVKIGNEYFPIEIKLIVNTSLSKYIVDTKGVCYMLRDLYFKEE